MSTATVTSKGQVTIPVDVRRALSINTGDRLEFVEIEPGKVLIVAATKSITDLKGRFAKPRQAVSIAEMNEAIGREASRRE
ncbi:AbrB/MazE/SpoVT family DNA-binding domain-containing protein [Asticcacaulis sp. AND118]|uniref:AbrB/MazE/SpoVT family DNA-binding domain-containing protein n=1 Tax=Asticcacaulis sp. AND118 TaxID=2840468 RepID=UPI001D000F61|nr:AbrB/MazE/SpoVT family DNA-binding domain-containing protein [Asticcacaulis sp. AND118]UDF03523.1 AbrB/MazE/SpoVT family DNA-binding domain-containing protein [Asticcacaulis sp. AND118]